MDSDPNKKVDDNSLEAPETSADSASKDAASTVSYVDKKGFISRLVSKVSFINVYLLLFIFIIILASFITYVGIRTNSNADDEGRITAQDLNDEAFQNLSDNNTVVGDPKQTLTVASNSIFDGKVLFRDSIDVAGTIRVGGSLSLPGITVSGTSNFESVQVTNTLAIGSDTTINGNLTIQRSLTVSGGASFGGELSAAQLNIDRLTLNQDITLNRHIDAGGPVPGVSSGTGVGAGGTVSISGSDIAGTVTVNVGSGAVAGVLANVSFANTYPSAPHVVVTPVGSSAGNLAWYITRSASGFSIATNNPAAVSSSFSFDYIVID